MEKSTRERLLDAGLGLLGTVGSRGCTARAAEEAAGVPHGSVRHHFSNQAGFLAALVERLFEVDTPRPDETFDDTLRRWLGSGRALTRARYELALLAAREETFRSAFLAGRDRYVDEVVGAAGLTREAAEQAVAMVDGLVLDAMIRGHGEIDVEGAVRVLFAGRDPTTAGVAATDAPAAPSPTGRPR